MIRQEEPRHLPGLIKCIRKEGEAADLSERPCFALQAAFGVLGPAVLLHVFAAEGGGIFTLLQPVVIVTVQMVGVGRDADTAALADDQVVEPVAGKGTDEIQPELLKLGDLALRIVRVTPEDAAQLAVGA